MLWDQFHHTQVSSFSASFSCKTNDNAVQQHQQINHEPSAGIQKRPIQPAEQLFLRTLTSKLLFIWSHHMRLLDETQPRSNIEILELKDTWMGDRQKNSFQLWAFWTTGSANYTQNSEINLQRTNHFWTRNIKQTRIVSLFNCSVNGVI